MKHLMNTKTEKLTRRGFAFLLALVLTTSAFVPGLTARATEGETPTLESLKPLKDYETAVVLLADLDTIAQALPEDAAKEDIKAVYDAVVAAQTDAEALTGDVALTEEKKAEVAAQAATILTYLTEQRGYVPAEPEAQNDEDEEDETPTCTCPEGTEGHAEGCPLYVAPCGTCGETGTHKADCATLCTCEDKSQPHVEGCPLYVAPCGTCGETGTHKADCATLCTCPEGTEGHLAECPLYICADCGLNNCICGLESAYLLNGAIVYKDYTNTESDAKAITGWNTAVKIQSSVTAEDGTVWYQFVYSNVLKELLNGYHYVKAADTTTLKCTCTPVEGEHAEDCPLYVEPTPYEKAMKELAALEEEAEHLADGLDPEAEDYIEKLTANCNNLYDRLFAIVGEAADLWENDTITDDEYYAAEEKAMEIIQYLSAMYGYENGSIVVLAEKKTLYANVLSTATTAESGITFQLFNYDKNINYKDEAATTKRDHSAHFIFASAQKHDVDYGRAQPSTTEVAHLGTNHLMYKMNLKGSGWGYPVIGKSSSGEAMNVSTDYLFGGKADHAVDAYTNITNTPLFYNATTGYYSYNSAKNAADLSVDQTRILVRDYNERGISAAEANLGRDYEDEVDQIADFFPFNSLVEFAEDGSAHEVSYGTTNKHNKSGNVYYYKSTDDHDAVKTGIDYWFGARMHANFYIPQDSQVNGENMQYHFTGDDDVLVYIDGVLVMDLGGAHSRCTGSIDFYTGIVETYLDGDVNHKTSGGEKYYVETIYDRFHKAYLEDDKSEAEAQTLLAEVFEPVLDANGKHKTVTDARGKSHLMYRFKDYTLHTFDWFYMERYSGQANFSTYFNLPTVPPGSVKVTKELTDSTVTSVTSNEEYTFQITYADGSSLPTEEKYTIDSVEKTTTNNGQFKLKPGETAVFDDLETGDANGIRYKVTEINAGQNSDLAKVNYTQNTQSIFESTTQNYIEFTLKPSDADGGTDDIAHELIYSNKLKKSDFTVTKKVTGNLGDRMRNFTFHAELYYDSTMTTKLTFPAGTGYEVNAENVAVFQLKHEDSITFENIPNGAYVKIVEVEEEYDTTIEGAESSADRVAFLTTDLTEDNDNVIFTNEKDVTIDTGISLDSIPYIVILVGVAAVVGFLFLRKRRVED